MAKKSASNTQKNLKTAAKVAKKAVPKSAVKKVYKKSGFHRAVPYLTILIGIILAIALVTVRLLDMSEGAGLLGYYFQLLFCGVFGGAAFLFPLAFCFIGVLWAILHFKEANPSRKGDEEGGSDLRRARRRTVSKTVLCFVFIFLLSVLLGVWADYSEVDVEALWNEAGEEPFAGGIVGGALGYLLNYAFQPVISSVILIIALATVLLFAVGLTPDYIMQKIRCRREARAEVYAEEDDDDQSAIKYEQMRAKELERARKKKLKQAEVQQKKALRRELEEDYEDEDDQPVAPPPAPKVKAKAEKKAPEPDVDELLEGIGETEETVAEEPILKPLEVNIEESIPETRTAATAADYGGDPIIDGDSCSLDNVLSNMTPKTPAAPEQQENIQMGEISNETLAEDIANVAPEEGEAEEPEEIVTPYIFPPVDILSPNKNPIDTDVTAELQENAKILMETLKSFKVNIREVSYSRGPTITRYELKPEVGTRVRAIANLVDDIALSLATTGVRIEAPIPNKAAVGIEVPNRNRATVYLRDLIENSKFSDAKSKLTSCLGMDVGGNPVYFDVGKMPHLLIAGTTGSGKSVCINTIILSILYKSRPDEVKLILVDPKQVEFTVYENIPHLYCPIVSEPKKAAGALASAVSEMERRFELIKEVGVRNIEAYNEVTANDPEKEYMPKMVIIIDELADLMMTARDEVETSICRLAQKARAAGIHVILGTQRPSVDVITGLIKANIPSRIACTVTSQVDSRTIIDVGGAENLIGYGDMLFAPVGSSKPTRVQGAFVSDGEVEKIVTFIKENNSSVKYNKAFMESMEENAKNCGMGKKGGTSDDSESAGGSNDGGDSKFNEAVKLAIEQGKISTSLMQRKLGVGYGRAAKIIDAMEELGYVSAPDGTKPRRVLITMQEYSDRVANKTLGGDDVG